MSSSRYREDRTRVRRLVRLPGQDREDFKRQIARLYGHFERFNVDVAELCQWLMSLRKVHAASNPREAKDNPAGFGTLGDFLLEPSLDGVDADEKKRDGWRRDVFDDVAGFRPLDALENRPVPHALCEAMEKETRRLATAPPEKQLTIKRLFERRRTLEPAHRLVLLKAAAEWIVARYQRGVEVWPPRN